MKKLLVLALILGVTSFASAGFVMTIDGSAVTDGVSVDIGSSLGMLADTEIPGYDVTLTFNELPVSEPTSYPTEFELESGLVADDALASNQIRISGSQLFGSPQSGVLFDSVDLSEIGSVDVYDNEAAAAIGTVNVVPEPMTMALLGLGGLLIRRRK